MKKFIIGKFLKWHWFCLLLIFVATALYGQTPPGYNLVKTGISSSASQGTFSYQWIASNQTSANDKFFIQENIPSGLEIQSIRESGFFTLNPSLNPPLPLVGSASFVVGPFSISANDSVTFQISGTVHGPGSSEGETFTLFSESQWVGKNGQGPVADSISGEHGTPTPTVTPTASPTETPVSPEGLVHSIVAAPNISRGNQPINFLLDLGSSARVSLSIFTVTGEKVFGVEMQGNQGVNNLIWAVQNSARESVASGLYLYLIHVSGAEGDTTKAGKVLVVH